MRRTRSSLWSVDSAVLVTVWSVVRVVRCARAQLEQVHSGAASSCCRVLLRKRRSCVKMSSTANWYLSLSFR